MEEGVRIVSCPTCGRCKTDTLAIVKEIKEKTMHIKKPITVAVMGCAVNGPGEARDAELGIAGGGEGGKLVIFRYGKPFQILSEAEAFETLKKYILEFCE